MENFYFDITWQMPHFPWSHHIWMCIHRWHMSYDSPFTCIVVNVYRVKIKRSGSYMSFNSGSYTINYHVQLMPFSSDNFNSFQEFNKWCPYLDSACKMHQNECRIQTSLCLVQWFLRYFQKQGIFHWNILLRMHRYRWVNFTFQYIYVIFTGWI